MAKQTVEELAKHIKLPRASTKKIVDWLKHDILISLYRKNPEEPAHMAEFNVELNNKIADLYGQYYGKKFDPRVHAKNKNLSLFLMGPPGQGKTAAYTVASKEVCEDLGLNFVDHVTDAYVPKKNDFVMVVQECAGENSAITFGGVPRAEEVEINGQKVTVLKKAVNYRFTVFEQCAGGVLLFDDAANAATVIQNVLLPVAQNHTFQGMAIKNACIGFTGNLGSLDGTYTSDLSSALRTRVIPMFITDNVKDFVKRGYEQYNDSLGDLGFLNFLIRDERKFSVLPEPGEKSGFACPRSWDNAIQASRASVERNGGRGVGEEEALGEIHAIVNATLGPEIGHELVSYFNSFIRGADPLAKSFILEDKFDADKLKAKYHGGVSSEDISFGYQFATACGDYAVNLIAESDNPDKMLEVATKRFGQATLQLNDSEFSYALEHLKNKMSSYIADFSKPKKDGRELRDDIKERIAKTIHALDDCSNSKRKAMIAVISDYDKISSASVIDRKVGPRKAIR